MARKINEQLIILLQSTGKSQDSGIDAIGGLIDEQLHLESIIVATAGLLRSGQFGLPEYLSVPTTSTCRWETDCATSPCLSPSLCCSCLLYTSDAADDLLCVDLGGRR